MTHSVSTASARRALISALTAVMMAAAIPEAALAGSNDGLWKVDPAKSSFSAGSATLTIERAAATNPAAGSFVVVSNNNVYLVTRATVGDSKGVRQADYGRMAKEGRAVLIGTNARSADMCGFRCQGGLSESRMTMTFRAVNGAGQQIDAMLAERN